MSQNTSKDGKAKSVAVELMKKIDRQQIDGTYIPPEEIEPLLAVAQDHKDYAFAMLAVRAALEDLIEGLTGEIYRIKQDHSGLRILTTSEAAQYGLARQEAKIRGFELEHMKTSACVNNKIDDLTSSERSRYQERQNVYARMILAMKNAEVRAVEGVGA